MPSFKDSQPDNPAAFPCYGTREVMVEGGYRTALDSDGGMQLLDYFAAQALALGWDFFDAIDDHSDPPNELEHAARCAYALADAMLAERAKREKGLR